MQSLIIQILKEEMKIVLLEDAKKIVVLGIFPIIGKTETAIKKEIASALKQLKLKNEPIIILPEPGFFPNSKDWHLSKQQISLIRAKASFEADRGQFKKRGTYLLLEIGDSVSLCVIEKDKQTRINERILNRMVADFREAISEPHESRYLQDFCSNHFFLRKTGKSALEAYNKLQDDPTEGAELFVEYGANMGALLANLDAIFEPNCIAITGTLATTFDAWSHAMGKMRNYHRGKKPACRVLPLKDKTNSAILGTATQL
jgi:hypothetical protein